MDTVSKAVEHARELLEKRYLLREVARLLEDGLSPVQLSESLGLSMQETRRLVFTATSMMKLGTIPVSPAEVIYEAAVGIRSRESMLESLVWRKYTYSRDVEPDNPLSARELGTWEDLSVCMSEGLLSEDEYQTILDRRHELKRTGQL